MPKDDELQVINFDVAELRGNQFGGQGSRVLLTAQDDVSLNGVWQQRGGGWWRSSPKSTFTEDESTDVDVLNSATRIVAGRLARLLR